MPEIQVFHDKLHHVLLLNYVEKWFQLQFSGFSKFSTCTHEYIAVIIQEKLAFFNVSVKAVVVE